MPMRHVVSKSCPMLGLIRTLLTEESVLASVFPHVRLEVVLVDSSVVTLWTHEVHTLGVGTLVHQQLVLVGYLCTAHRAL